VKIAKGMSRTKAASGGRFLAAHLKALGGEISWWFPQGLRAGGSKDLVPTAPAAAAGAALLPLLPSGWRCADQEPAGQRAEEFTLPQRTPVNEGDEQTENQGGRMWPLASPLAGFGQFDCLPL